MIRQGAIVLAALAAVTATMAASGAKAQNQGRQCFRQSDVTSWRAVGDKAVNVQTNYRDVYHLTFSYPCYALSSVGERLGFKHTGFGPICTGLDLDILVHGMDCPVQTITKLTKAQMAAMPKKELP